MKFTKIELEILDQALTEYEENHYQSEDDSWQKIINNLMIKIYK
jgi:hypothetical protein